MSGYTHTTTYTTPPQYHTPSSQTGQHQTTTTYSQNPLSNSGLAHGITHQTHTTTYPKYQGTTHVTQTHHTTPPQYYQSSPQQANRVGSPSKLTSGYHKTASPTKMMSTQVHRTGSPTKMMSTQVHRTGSPSKLNQVHTNVHTSGNLYGSQYKHR